jgi:hypothetical protein
MIQRFSLVLVVFAAVALFMLAPTASAADTQEGTFVKAGDGKITITDSDKKDKTYDLAKDAKVACDTKDCKVEDLKAGVKVKLTIEKDKVTKVDASTKGKDNKDK